MSVCLSVCPEHNSKTYHPNMFKLGIGNDLRMSYNGYDFGVERSKAKVWVRVMINSKRRGFELYECLLVLLNFPTWKNGVSLLLSVQCVHIPNRGFRRGNYRCECPPSQLRPSNSSGSTAVQNGLDGVELERAYVEKLLSGGIGPPVSCPGCGRVCSDALCTHERACMADYDPLLRGIPLGVQSLCITVTIILTFVIVRLRKTKVVRSRPMSIVYSVFILLSIYYYIKSDSQILHAQLKWFVDENILNKKYEEFL